MRIEELSRASRREWAGEKGVSGSERVARALHTSLRPELITHHHTTRVSNLPHRLRSQWVQVARKDSELFNSEIGHREEPDR